MTTPATTLDPRFSDPDAAATGWQPTRRALGAAEPFALSKGAFSHTRHAC